MKTKKVLCLISIILFISGWNAQLGAQDIPPNYIQNPNMEHDLNTIFWYGSWDYTWGSNGIASHPEYYLTQDDAHSGNTCMRLDPGGWIWVSYPVRGHEQKKFKASFWYKGYFNNYWNFIYRDVGITHEELHWDLAEYVGADSAGWGGAGQDAIMFWFGGEDGFTEDWTYFEFVWDYPGTIPGWGNTTMWWGEYDPAYLDDFYYGEWYDGHYSGEEPFGFINGDFEMQVINIEWTLNVGPWDVPPINDYLSLSENHTEAGSQSLRLQDYWWKETAGSEPSVVNRNVLYQLPAMGAGGEEMEISFWYKGNNANLDLRFYGNYGVTPDQFPLPAGSILVGDTAKTEYEVETVVKFDDQSTMTVGDLGLQNFDNPDNLKLPGSSWLWSGSNHYTWDDWTTGVTDLEAHSGTSSFILPGDPNWTGAEGDFSTSDNTTYVWSFWYKGKAQFELKIGENLKYDLVGDPDGIVPGDATADEDVIHWDLDAEDWTQFSFSYNTNTWLADSGVTAPAKLYYDFVGTYDDQDTGYIDDVFIGVVEGYDKPYGTTFTMDLDTISATVPPLAARWTLPTVADWTEWKLKWTNPQGDIGSTLALFLDALITASPDVIIDGEKEEFDDNHPGWTYFDDFYYGIAEPEGIDRSRVSYDLYTYPNPARDILYLSIQIPLGRVDIFNSTGQLQMTLDHPERILNINGLADGLYFINATDENGVVHKAKFIKR